MLTTNNIVTNVTSDTTSNWWIEGDHTRTLKWVDGNATTSVIAPTNYTFQALHKPTYFIEDAYAKAIITAMIKVLKQDEVLATELRNVIMGTTKPVEVKTDKPETEEKTEEIDILALTRDFLGVR